MIPLPPWATLKLLKLATLSVVVISVGLLLWRVNVWHTKAGKLDVAVKALAECQQSAKAAKDRADRLDASYVASQQERDQAKAQVQVLLTLPKPDPKTLIIERPTNAPVTSCPDRSPDFRVQYNAIVTAGGYP